MRWIVSFRNSLNQPQISPQAPVASDLKTLKKKKSENPVDLWCVHHFLGFIPTHVILKNMRWCILKNSPLQILEILLPTKPIFFGCLFFFDVSHQETIHMFSQSHNEGFSHQSEVLLARNKQFKSTQHQLFIEVTSFCFFGESNFEFQFLK